MYKIAILIAVSFSGCSYFTFNAAMCEQIARDPDAVVPKECRNYNKKEADKAFHKVKNEKKVSPKDIEFDKDKNE